MSNILQKSWSITSELLVQEAAALWLESEILCRDKNFFYIRGNGKEILFKSNDFWWNSSLAKKVVDDKELSHIMLERWGFPIPHTTYVDRDTFDQLDPAIFTHWRYPLVIKPIDGSHGNGVMMGILDTSELLLKLKSSLEKYPRMIVQEEVKWDECRVVVMFWEVVLAINRIPPRIIGDGISTIRELIEIENQSNLLRWKWYDSALSQIMIDDELVDYITKRQKNLDSILLVWELLQLRWNSNIGTWWTIEEITDSLHPSIPQICSQIAEKLDMQLLCLDIMSIDFSRPLTDVGWVILEVWWNPWFGWDRELTSVNTAQTLLQKLFF